MAEVVAGAEHGQGNLRGVLPAGTSLRGYELKSILGQGAFGITYRGRDLNLDRDVAIKEYLPTSLALREGRTTVLPRSPDHAEQFAWGRERFLEEARTLAKLDRTPAIVRVHDYLEDNGTAYMVMALIEGETLAKRLQREQRLAPEAIELLLFPLLDGLEEVHGVGFLHRDIKPANIMVDAKGRPTLIDFGASRAAMAERSTTLTAIFTPGYAAAEQFTSATLGPWSDIYGLAATLYHAITGQIPPSAIDRILNDRYEPLSELKPVGFDPALLAGIDIALAIRAEDRPQSIAEWRQMLKPEAFHASSMEATRIARKPGPLARVAGRSRKARITIGARTLWAAAAAAILIVAGGGYLGWVASTSPSLSTATLNLTAEQLEQALAERRKADTLAAEKRRLEDEARQKAQTETAAQLQAEAELEQARQARQKAEDELAKLKASIEAARQADSGQPGREAAAARRVAEEAAQRKAEAEAAVLRQAEEDAQKKAAADAEAKRQADEALARAEAERQEAEQAARLKADAEAAAISQASDEAQRKAAEAEKKAQIEEAEAKAQAKAKADAEKAEAVAAESGLRLDETDRKRLQVALTSLGFDTRGADGVFGPRTREMITGWQQKAGLPATGYLPAAQRDQLLRAAAPAVTRWDEEQKKIEDEKKKAEEARTAAAAAPVPTPTASATGTYDGVYTGLVDAPNFGARPARVEVIDGKGSGTVQVPGCPAQSFSITISSTGDISGTGRGFSPSGCDQIEFSLSGRAGRRDLQFSTRGTAGGDGNPRGNARVFLTRSTGDANVAAAPNPGTPSTIVPDGPYSGEATAAGYATIRSRMFVSLQMANGRGSGTIESPGSAGCGASPFSLSVSPTGSVSGEGNLTCPFGSAVEKILPGPVSVSGTYRDGRFELSFGNNRFSFNATLNRGTRARPSAAGPFDGTYGGNGMLALANSPGNPVGVTIRIAGMSGSGELKFTSCSSPASLQITAAGEVAGSSQMCEPNNRGIPITIRGRVGNGQLEAVFSSLARSGSLVLKLGAAASEVPAPPSTNAYDGIYAGGAVIPNASGHLARFRAVVENGRGSGTLTSPVCGVSTFSFTIASAGDITGSGELFDSNCKKNQVAIQGRVNGRTLSFNLGTRSVILSPSSGSDQAVPSGAFDGTYSGSFGVTGGQGVRHVSISVVGGRGSGTIGVPGRAPCEVSFDISPQGDLAGQLDSTCRSLSIAGRADGRGIEFRVGASPSTQDRAYLSRSDGNMPPAASQRWTATAAFAPSSALNAQCFMMEASLKRGFTFELGESVLFVRGGATYEVPVAPDGTVRFRLAGNNLELSGNARTRELRLTNANSGCAYDLTPQ